MRLKVGSGCLMGVALMASSLLAGPAMAASCGGAAGFDSWLAGFKREAAQQGVSANAISALDNVRFDSGIIAKDRGQSVFSQSFLQFSSRMVSNNRLQKGTSLIRKYSSNFSQVERQYGVPAAVITAFWGLETDFGAVQGNSPTLQSIATLAWDCRRPEMFRPELLAALQLIDRGDATPDQMRGAWAGELGQTQFMPSYYLKYAVDADGDGRRDLVHSVPDVLASTGNFLASYGWQRNQPWLQEVRVPTDLPWAESGLDIQHPRSFWAKLGVTQANGRPLPMDGLPSSLDLPMGRNGPAFLAYPNFQVFLKWNQSAVYSTTAAYFAARLDGAGPVHSGNAPVTVLSPAEVKQLQTALVRQGFETGEIDGKLGEATRAGVKKAQIKYGLPADAYPTPELLARLRGG